MKRARFRISGTLIGGLLLLCLLLGVLVSSSGAADGKHRSTSFRRASAAVSHEKSQPAAAPAKTGRLAPTWTI